MAYFKPTQNNNTQSTNTLGQTIPLYEMVKQTIYIKFEELVNAHSNLGISENKSEYRLSLLDFRNRFNSFVTEINHKNKLNLLKHSQQKYLQYFYNNPNEINYIVSVKLMKICREIIESMGITQIESVKINEYDAF